MLANGIVNGIRPIGVGEVLRRLLGKAMVLATGIDVEELCGADQLSSGLKGGFEERFILLGVFLRVNRMKVMVFLWSMQKMRSIQLIELWVY